MTKIQEKKTFRTHSIQEICSETMSESIWKDLPPEVLENVLACLPTHVLCRFRLVCKEWNHLISQPSFAVLHALSPCKASSIFISPKLNYNAMPSAEWQVLDPMEKRSYKLSDSFIVNSYLFNNRDRRLKNPFWQLEWYKYTLAADGELIYTMYETSDWPTMPRMHIVCNPVSKSFHEIPELPEIREFYHRDIMVMSVDNATKTYKIITAELSLTKYKQGSQNLFLYESVTSMWRKLCEVPNAGLSICSSIFMKGIFYTLFVVSFGIPTWPMFYPVVLYSCDLVTGAWSKIDVDFPPLSTTAKEYLQLVVSLGQLYMVKFIRCKRRMVMLSIWKVVLETKEVVKVVELQNFCKLLRKMICMSKEIDMPVAVGCANSIIISCTEGRCIKFDLLEKSWQELPGHTLDKGSGICACLIDF